METLETIQIVRNPEVLGGKPILKGRRMPVHLLVFRAIYQQWLTSQIQEAHNVSLAEIYAALSYYYLHQAEIDAIIAEEDAEEENIPRLSDLDAIIQAMIDTETAAQTLGITERAVRKLIESGTLPAKKIGGKWLIHPEHLNHQAVKQRRPGPRSKKE